MLYALCIIFLIWVFYGKKYTIKGVGTFSIVFGIINGVFLNITRLFGSEFYVIKTIVSYFVSVLIIKLLLKVDFKSCFIVVAFYYIVMLISESLLYLIYRLVNIINIGGIIPTFTDSLINIIVGNIIILLLSFLVIYLTNFFKSYLKAPKNTRTTIITLMLTAFIILANMWVFYYNIKSYTNIVIFAIITILMLVYCIYMIFNVNISYKLERQSIELEQQKFYNTALDNTLNNIRRFKHGYNNNLNVLYAFAKLGQYDEMLNYFNEVMEMNNRLNDTAILDIKNAALYGLVASKIQYAEENGVSFKVSTNGEIKDIQNIRMIDLCEIIGIFLDNAIEAAIESDDKTVVMETYVEFTSIRIIVKNSFKSVPDINKISIKGFSTKGEKRGMGLWIVGEIIKSNKHVLNNTCIKDNMFQQELIIEKGN